MRPDAVLVLDVGSSSTKAVLFAADGSTLGQAEAGYPTATAAGRSEQWPPDWEAAAARAIADLGRLPDLRLVALSGTMQNLIPVGADFAPLAPAMLYSDARAASRGAALSDTMRTVGAEGRLGNHVEPLMTCAKLDWLRAEEPRLFERTFLFHAGAKDYLASRLTGARTTDPTSASTTGLMNLWSRDWDDAVLALLAVERARLPEIRPAEDVVGQVGEEAAKKFGLGPGIPVMNGCGDAGAATLGAGLLRPEQAYVYVGTSGWVARSSTAARRDPLPVYTLAHPFAGMLIEIAPILSAGDAAAWVTEVLGTQLDGADAELAAEKADAAPGDLVFLPYLKGERSPFNDAAVRGAFIGLDRGHGRGDLHLAVLEGVGLALRHNLETLGGAEGPIAMLGGGAGSRLWPQVMADMLGHAVAVPSHPTAATALGAFHLAAKHLGWPASEARPAVRLQPRAERRDRTGRLYRRYRELSSFARMLGRTP